MDGVCVLSTSDIDGVCVLRDSLDICPQHVPSLLLLLKQAKSEFHMQTEASSFSASSSA